MRANRKIPDPAGNRIQVVQLLFSHNRPTEWAIGSYFSTFAFNNALRGPPLIGWLQQLIHCISRQSLQLETSCIHNLRMSHGVMIRDPIHMPYRGLYMVYQKVVNIEVPYTCHGAEFCNAHCPHKKLKVKLSLCFNWAPRHIAHVKYTWFTEIFTSYD